MHMQLCGIMQSAEAKEASIFLRQSEMESNEHSGAYIGNLPHLLLSLIQCDTIPPVARNTYPGGIRAEAPSSIHARQSDPC